MLRSFSAVVVDGVEPDNQSFDSIFQVRTSANDPNGNAAPQ